MPKTAFKPSKYDTLLSTLLTSSDTKIVIEIPPPYPKTMNKLRSNMYRALQRYNKLAVGLGDKPIDGKLSYNIENLPLVTITLVPAVEFSVIKEIT